MVKLNMFSWYLAPRFIRSLFDFNEKKREWKFSLKIQIMVEDRELINNFSQVGRHAQQKDRSKEKTI